ncbi:hypothetical protein ADUPG1_013718 [Aduncisulcus paluster]|uniref:Uncharacterized protein n=1 Tax=Aduncisulcus paluster TaxID=2918883 RepID=A0ABQ5K3Y0_9EUKA|nr:hypothetical protein ADUPG1_013718 [Aduncisulcus paluster]
MDSYRYIDIDNDAKTDIELVSSLGWSRPIFPTLSLGAGCTYFKSMMVPFIGTHSIASVEFSTIQGDSRQPHELHLIFYFKDGSEITIDHVFETKSMNPKEWISIKLERDFNDVIKCKIIARKDWSGKIGCLITGLRFIASKDEIQRTSKAKRSKKDLTDTKFSRGEFFSASHIQDGDRSVAPYPLVDPNVILLDEFSSYAQEYYMKPGEFPMFFTSIYFICCSKVHFAFSTPFPIFSIALCIFGDDSQPRRLSLKFNTKDGFMEKLFQIDKIGESGKYQWMLLHNDLSSEPLIAQDVLSCDISLVSSWGSCPYFTLDAIRFIVPPKVAKARQKMAKAREIIALETMKKSRCVEGDWRKCPVSIRNKLMIRPKIDSVTGLFPIPYYASCLQKILVGKKKDFGFYSCFIPFLVFEGEDISGIWIHLLPENTQLKEVSIYFELFPRSKECESSVEKYFYLSQVTTPQWVFLPVNLTRVLSCKMVSISAWNGNQVGIIHGIRFVRIEESFI